VNELLFKNKRNGFFVDIGATDGVSISNSYFFEKELGWKGICFEPRKGPFEQLRKNRDCICINACAYKEDTTVEFADIDGYCDALSGITAEYCEKHKNRISNEMAMMGGETRLERCKAFRLATVFDMHGVDHVDYMSIDTEGSEMAVLQGIDFNKVTIDAIEVEVNYPEDEETILTTFLEEKGFHFVAKIGGDNLYLRNGVEPDQD
jgi:FkbM family methyltransferase